MTVLPSSERIRRLRRPSAVVGAAILTLLLMLPGVALLGNSAYHHPFTPGGAHVFESARNLAPISEWGTVLIISGVFVLFMFSKDAWWVGTAGCLIGFVASAFLTWSFLTEVGSGKGWYSAAESFPTCLAALAGMIMSAREHTRRNGVPR